MTRPRVPPDGHQQLGERPGVGGGRCGRDQGAGRGLAVLQRAPLRPQADQLVAQGIRELGLEGALGRAAWAAAVAARRSFTTSRVWLSTRSIRAPFTASERRARLSR